MAEPLFDDHSSIPDQTGHKDTEANTPTSPTQHRNRSLKWFNEEDLLDEGPKDDDPLYPDLTEPPSEPTAPKRPLPWIIDIFLYPFNRAGSLTLAILLIAPTILASMTYGSIILAGTSPLLIFIGVPLGIAAFLALVLMMLYYVWYVTECIRDSSDGAIRAPDTIGQSPGLMELFGHFFRVTVCSLVFVGLFLFVTHTFPLSPLAELALGIILGLIYPIALLGVVTLESLRGLNPVTHVRLIFKTGLSYVPFSITLCATHILLYWVCNHYLPHDGWLSAGKVVFVLFEFYGLLVSAHVLGRFAWRQRDRLFWE